MVGIPRMAKDPKASFKLVEFLYLSKEAIEARRGVDDILPPIKTMWDDPIYQEPDPFYGGQKVGALFVELARELPPRLVTPFTSIALATLTRVVHDAMDLGKQGYSGAELEQRCQKLLDAAAEDVRRRIEFGKFEG
jgi:arabinosaccharide transport system substrate-binding protein